MFESGHAFNGPKILVVGAGLAGAVYARTLADAGCSVHVIDRRPHIAGNAFDEIDEHGIRIHRYGPHLFHTSNQTVLKWISRFGNWMPYTHRVRALLPTNSLAPLPINIDTLNIVFGVGLKSKAEAQKFLGEIAISNENPRNAAEYLASRVGIKLCDLFFRPYTKKMWDLDLEDLDATVVKRIPINFDNRDSYFRESETQLLPKDGYTKFVANLLDDLNIKVSVSEAFEKSMCSRYDYTFLSMAIDEFYEFEFGNLPYRSLRFHHRTELAPAAQGPWACPTENTFSVLNFTDESEFTRETAWHRLPGHLIDFKGTLVLTKEEPCDYLDNNLERYYPINDSAGVNQAVYRMYRDLAEADKERFTFIGRCGTYRYLDMDQVINQSLMGANEWLRLQGLRHSSATQFRDENQEQQREAGKKD